MQFKLARNVKLHPCIHYKQKSNGRGELKETKPPKVLNVYLNPLSNNNRYIIILK